MPALTPRRRIGCVCPPREERKRELPSLTTPRLSLTLFLSMRHELVFFSDVFCQVLCLFDNLHTCGAAETHVPRRETFFR